MKRIIPVLLLLLLADSTVGLRIELAMPSELPEQDIIVLVRDPEKRARNN